MVAAGVAVGEGKLEEVTEPHEAEVVEEEVADEKALEHSYFLEDLKVESAFVVDSEKSY